MLDRVPKQQQAEARALLCAMPYAETRQEAEEQRDSFIERFGNAYPDAAKILRADWERIVTFYGFPKEHWKHLRTTNIVESPFAAVRLRTTAAKRVKKVANATALIWRVLLVAERSFRRLDHPQLLAEVAEGAKYQNGIRVVEKVHTSDQEAGRLMPFTHQLTGPPSVADYSWCAECFEQHKYFNRLSRLSRLLSLLNEKITDVLYRL